jgi:hypothetical protein
MENARHFSPWASTPRPCWHCAHFVGLIYAGSAARCGLPLKASVVATPSTGCAFWLREVGADDEPGPPALDALSLPGRQATPLVPVSPPSPPVQWAP